MFKNDYCENLRTRVQIPSTTIIVRHTMHAFNISESVGDRHMILEVC